MPPRMVTDQPRMQAARNSGKPDGGETAIPVRPNAQVQAKYSGLSSARRGSVYGLGIHRQTQKHVLERLIFHACCGS